MATMANPGRGDWRERWGVPALDLPGANVFVAALFIQSIGNGLFYTFILIYFHKVLDLPLARVGLAVTVASAITLAISPIAGQIVDRAGAKRMVIFSQAIQATGYLCFFAVGSIPMVAVVIFITTLGERIFWVAFPTLVANIAPEGERDRWYAFTSAVRNGGLGLGGLVAGVVIWLAGETGYSLLLGANVAGFTVAAALLLLRVPRFGERVRAEHETGGYREVLRDIPGITVIGANTVYAYCALMIFFALPIYVVDTLGLPAWMVGFLFALNTAQLALGQTLAIRKTGNMKRTRVLMISGVIWIVAAGLFAAALLLPDWVLLPYITAVVMLYTVGELLHAPTATSLVAGLAPESLRGRYLALLSVSWGIAQTAGPAIFTGLLTLGAGLPWIVTALFAGAGVVLCLSAESRIPMRLLRPRSFEAA